MRWSLVVAFAGCGFTHGTLPGDAPPGTSDAPRDGLVDTPAAPTCYDKWLDGTIRFDTPVALATVSSSGFDRDPFLTGDELTLYFSSARGGGDADVWMATRASIADSFSTPVEASEFNSTSNEAKLSLSADGTIAVVGSDRPGSMSYDVWESIRTATSQPFPAMNRTNVLMVESAGNEHDPTLCADGQHLYLAPDGAGPQQIVVATRGSNGTFGAPVPLTQLAGGNGDADPSPTPDERILIFSSNRTLAGAGNGDMWYSTRASTSADFGTPTPVPDLNTTLAEGDAHLSSDGCRLYFARNVPGTDYDIFVAVGH